MKNRARYLREMREHGFTRIEIKGVLRRLDAGDHRLEAFWKECWIAAQVRKEQGKSKWLRPHTYITAG